MECVDLQTFHKHYCAMVISYNVANCFFRWGSCCFFGFFLYFLGGVGKFVLGDFVGGFVWEGFCGAFCSGGGGLPGVLSGGVFVVFFVRWVFDGEGLLRFFVNEVFVGGFCRGVFVSGFCRGVLSVFFYRRGFCRGFLPGGGG